MKKRNDVSLGNQQEEQAALSRPIAEVKANVFKALGHPARILVLELLATGERSVSEIHRLEPSHLSQ
jgi:DNA-binding transcriptional ArsR family regulator